MEFWVLISEAEASAEQGSASARKKKKKTHYLRLKMDPWLIPLSELNAPKMLREERRNTGGEEVVSRRGTGDSKKKKIKKNKIKQAPASSHRPVSVQGQHFGPNCTLSNCSRLYLDTPAPPMWVQIKTVSCSRSLLASRSFWPSIQDSGVNRSTERHNQTARKTPPSLSSFN